VADPGAGPQTQQVQKIAVDPAWMGWSPNPARIRVSAEVRLKDAGAPGGFHLEYESTERTLTRAPGAVWLPAGDTGWVSVQWDLDNPQFAGRWGYHLALVGDLPTPNYLLRRLQIARRP
jgi:hypothetical protein